MQQQKEFLPEIPVVREMTVGKEALREGGRGIIYGIAAYCLAICRLPFGIYPFGIALLAAAPSKVGYIAAGLCAAALSGVRYGGVRIAAVLLTVILRLLLGVFFERGKLESAALPTEKLGWIRAALFKENIYLRLCCAAVGTFIVGLYTVVAGGYRYYDLFGVLLDIIICPMSARLLAYHFERESKGERIDIRWAAGNLFLLGALAYSVRNISLFGISAAAVGVFFASCLAGAKRGPLCGAVVGFVCGLAYHPLYAPAFVFAGIVIALLFRLSPIISTGAAVAAAAVWGLYIDGLGALGGFVAGVVLGGTAFCGIVKAGFLSTIVPRREEGASAAALLECQRLGGHIESNEERFGDISAAFESLSEMLYNISDRLRRPGIIDLRRVCDSALDKSCPSCSRRDICWGAEYGMSLDMVSRMCERLQSEGKVEPESEFGSHCKNFKTICEQVNERCAVLTEAVMRSEKVGVIALDYSQMSKIITEALSEGREQHATLPETAERVGRALARIGVRTEAVIVFGGRRQGVIARGVSFDRAGICASAIRMAAERVCGVAFEQPTIDLAAESGASMMLTARRKFCAEQAVYCLAANRGEVCGDSAVCFEDKEDRAYAIISDGMGSGGEAAFTSGLVTLFLEKMLAAGNGIQTSLRLLNSLLRSRSGARELECSATVDLLCFDLLSGGATVIKSGAATGYVRREGRIYPLDAQTVPIGILATPDAGRIKFELVGGDAVIMVSDGAEGEDWLPRLLEEEWENAPSVMAEKIVKRAAARGSRDDISAAVVVVSEL